MTRTLVPYVVAASFALVLSGCGGAATGTTSTSASQAPSTSVVGQAATGPQPSSGGASPSPAVSSAAGTSAQVDACALLTLDQMKTLYSQVTQVARVTANAKPLTCRFEDAKPVEYATLLVHQGGSALDILGKDNPQLGLTNHPLPDLGQNAAYRLFQMQPKDAAQLAALAAVKDGWQVELLFSKVPTDSAPGEPNFVKATGLLKTALQKL